MNSIRLFLIATLLLTAGTATAQTTAPDAAATTPAATTAPETPAGDPPAAQDTAAPMAETAEPAPAPAPAPAPTAACFPACRQGFICHAGMCVSGCNPPCAAGYECTAELTCALTQTSLDVVRQQEQTTREQKKQAKREYRLSYRRSPRVNLHILTGVSGHDDLQIMMPGFQAGVGYRQNYVDFFGLSARVGGFVGIASVSVDEDDLDPYEEEPNSDTVVGGFVAEISPFFGPLGRFHIGPMAWLMVLSPADEVISDGISDYSLSTGVLAGAGIDMGMALGAREQIHIEWRIKSNFTEQMPFWVQLGVSFDLMASKE